MLLNKIRSIFIASLISITGLVSQSYYQVLADYTGQNKNASVIEAAATKFAEVLPIEFRSQFKVLEFSSYVYEENMHGNMLKAWEEAETKAGQAANYYILHIYLSNNTKFNFDVKTIVKFPNTTNFNCIDADASAMLRGIIEGEARRELLSPNLAVGITNGLAKASNSLERKISCCNTNTKCQGYSAQEMIDALLSAEYFQLSPNDIYVFNTPPGGGVIGTIDIKLDFEDHGFDLTYSMKSFLQNGGGYARMRKFDKSNDTLFKVDKPTNGNWKDAVVIEKDGQYVILLNVALDPSGANLVATPQALVYAVRLVYEIGSEIFFDCLIQLVFEKFSTGSDWATAWNTLELDGASLKEAFKNGTLNFVASLFGGQTASAKNKAIINGLTAAVQYLLSFNNYQSGSKTEFIPSVSVFSLGELVKQFMLGAAGDDVEAAAKHSKKIIPKLKSRLSGPNARDNLKQILNNTVDNNKLNKLRSSSDELNDFINNIYWKSFKNFTSSSKLSKFFGIDDYENLTKAVKNNESKLESLGAIKGDKLLKPEVHHLIEIRLAQNSLVTEWLGSNTNKWKSIVLTKQDHDKFTEAWLNKIGRKNMDPPNVHTVTKQDVKDAAKEIYKGYPEILEILGL